MILAGSNATEGLSRVEMIAYVSCEHDPFYSFAYELCERIFAVKGVLNLSVKQTIEALRGALGANNDSELARKLNVGKSTISSWRLRGAVPDRYISVLSGGSNEAVGTPPVRWGDFEGYAFAIALVRFARAVGPHLLDVDFRTLYDFAELSRGGFWVFMSERQRELAAQADNGSGKDVHAAYMLALHDVAEATEAMVEDDREELLEWLRKRGS